MMDLRTPLQNQIDLYEEQWFGASDTGITEDRSNIKKLREFIASHPDCFSRTLLEGHVTASGLVVTEDFEQVLLTHHKKLGTWLQLGGHCDGDSEVQNVALRECQEESGLTDLKIFDPCPYFNSISFSPLFFDIDIHTIPERKNEPNHIHYDIRYLVV